MKASFAFSLTVLAVCSLTTPVLAQQAQADEKDKKWTCAVPSHVQLISAHYTGGKWASIHIAPFSSGGSYQVTREGDVAKGVTANGTEFVCTVVANKS